MSGEYYDSFLSYRDTDVASAREIYERLATAGFRVWFDKDRLEAGMRWHEEIERHCEASRVVILLLTPEWKESQWTRYETYGAEFVVPLLLRGTWGEVATPPLAVYQCETDWERLCKRIRGFCDMPRLERQGRVAMLKHRPIDHFVGRDLTMVELHEKLFLDRMTALTHGSVIAIPALGGVGKTTLARHYAEKFWRCYQQMFWIDCRSGIEAGFAEIYDLLHPGQTLPVDVRAKRAKQALEQMTPEHRLLVLDNAEDEESIQAWIHATGNAHVLITSRFTGWSKGITTHPVWVLDKEPARELLLKRSGLPEDAAADLVAEKVQCLPLALEQAAAYVAEQTGFGFADYLRLYEANEKDFLDRKTPGATNYPDSVYLTWQATRYKLPEGAKEMLRLHAFFAATPFPMSLYIAGLDADEQTVREWKSNLVRYSMARAEPDDCISVHALVQAVERHEMGADAAGVAQRAARMYLNNTPAASWNLQSQVLWAKLVSHSYALAGSPLVGQTLLGDIFDELTHVFYHAANYGEGAAAAERALEARERGLGKDHPRTLMSANNLALLLYDRGDYERAEPLYHRVIGANERLLGEGHPVTLASVANLALLFYSKGDYEQAEPLFRHAVETNERVLGKEHPNTLTSVNNLALLLSRKGNHERAEELYRRVIEASESREHPNVLSSLTNLAELLHRRGDLDQAESLHRHALEAWERVLGQEHPNTLLSAHNLAALLVSKSDDSAAEPLFRRALEGSRKVLGPDHPTTKIFADNYASLLARMQK